MRYSDDTILLGGEKEIMKVEKIESYPGAKWVLDEGADIAVHQTSRYPAGASMGRFCHVMVSSFELMNWIREKFGWPLTNAPEGLFTLFAAEMTADEVKASLEEKAEEIDAFLEAQAEEVEASLESLASE